MGVRPTHCQPGRELAAEKGQVDDETEAVDRRRRTASAVSGRWPCASGTTTAECPDPGGRDARLWLGLR